MNHMSCLGHLKRLKIVSFGVLFTLLASPVWSVMAQQPAASESAPLMFAHTPLVSDQRKTALGRASTVGQGDNHYRIGPGDLLDVTVFNRPQLSREARVDMRGSIKLPLIEADIQATCRTEGELASEIAALYRDRKYLKTPQVYVTVKDYQSQLVAVLGAVNSPGRFQLQRRIRLLELLVFHAGGPAQNAGSSIRILSTKSSSCEVAAVKALPPDTANTGTEQTIVSYNLEDLLQGDDASNPYVNPGDIVTIPEAKQALIVGNVLRPMAIPLTEPITLTRAIAMSGGTLPDTKSDKIRIVRQLQGGRGTMDIFVDLTAINKRQAEDIALEGGDIVDVPTKIGIQSILKGLFRTMVPMASQLPVRVVR
jgi:polysaccharide export outer membrane protein